MSVSKNDMTNIRILKAIKIRAVLKNFSIRICRIDRLILMLFNTFIIPLIDEISRSNILLRESPGFVIDNFKTI